MTEKLKKKRVRFIVPVDFEYYTEAALKEAISRFRVEPCYSIMAGDWCFEMKRPYLQKDAKP